VTRAQKSNPRYLAAPNSGERSEDGPREGPGYVLRATVPLRIRAGANLREHWAVRAKRTKKERGLGGYLALNSGAVFAMRAKLPLLVRWVRIIGKRGREMDSDNLPNAFKALRDGFAAVLGAGDAKRGPLSWEYAEERGKDWGVRVEISALSAKAAAPEVERARKSPAATRTHGAINEINALATKENGEQQP